MAKVRTLVPLTHPKTGEQFAAGVELDVDDEVFRDWRADGKVADVAQEQANAAQPQHFGERTGREDTTSTTPAKGKK
jgi:hypothetical protein